MVDMGRLKAVCQENDQALTMSVNPAGDVFIYVNPDATEKEMMQAMLLASTRICEEWGNLNRESDNA